VFSIHQIRIPIKTVRVIVSYRTREVSGCEFSACLVLAYVMIVLPYLYIPRLRCGFTSLSSSFTVVWQREQALSIFALRPYFPKNPASACSPACVLGSPQPPHCIAAPKSGSGHLEFSSELDIQGNTCLFIRYRVLAAKLLRYIPSRLHSYLAA
jgi:hypothetical protein